MRGAVLFSLVASCVATQGLRGPALRPEKPVDAFAREPLPPRPLSGHVAHDLHRNFPYDAFSTTFKCDKGPCPGSTQCGCAVCPCATPPPPAPCAAPPCGAPAPCAVPPCGAPAYPNVISMAVAGPATKTKGPKTGGNGNDAKPVMVPRGSLPDKTVASFFVESSEQEKTMDCPACCPAPCSPTCTCAPLKDMPVAGPATKTKGPKTGGNGNDAKPVMVPHGSLPPKGTQLPLIPAGCGTPPCGALLEEQSARPDQPDQPDPKAHEEASSSSAYVVKGRGESLTLGNTDKPEAGETVTKSKTTGTSGEWRKPTFVTKGTIEHSVVVPAGSSFRAGPAAEAAAVPAAEEALSHRKDPQGEALREQARQETAYESRVAAVKQEANEAKEETISSFVPKLTSV